jgi:hypothetical protein
MCLSKLRGVRGGDGQYRENAAFDWWGVKSAWLVLQERRGWFSLLISILTIKGNVLTMACVNQTVKIQVKFMIERSVM